VTGTARDNDWDRSEPTFGRKVAYGILAACGLVVLYLIGAAVIPRWWAQRVADVVDKRMTVGALFGLFIGLVFTVVPLIVAWIIIRLRSPRRTWKGWLGWLAVVALAAAPNLMTLGIVTGNSNAAHAGDRILDVDGPGFRLWSLIGAILGVVAVAVVWYLARSRRTERRRASEYRDELRARDQPT
jgi:hypothetical protein